MAHITYHGDPKRNHHFWIYPTHKSLINTQWDAYDPTHICNNFTLVDGCSDVKKYLCNGHQNAVCPYPGSCGNISMPQMTYHGDPRREHHFWVYPRNKSLINTQWDTYDPNHLCNNFTALDGNNSNQVRTFRCNGHPSISPYGMPVNAPIPQMTFHGDPRRENHFWVYPRNKSLINTQWDTYDPTHLCNNFTALDGDNPNQVRTFRCNGHSIGWPGGAGGFYPAQY